MKRLILFLSAMLSLLSTDATAKTLVVYYSYTGNCREIVNTLTSQIEADVLEIQPAEKGLRYEANNYALGTQLLNAIKANPKSSHKERMAQNIDIFNFSLSDDDMAQIAKMNLHDAGTRNFGDPQFVKYLIKNYG